MTEAEKKARVHETEAILSVLLRTGVYVSLAIVILGTLITFLHHPIYSTSQAELPRLTKPGAEFPTTIGQAAQGILRLEGRSIVVAGLILLIATPVLRVAISVLIFFHQRDWVFVALTSFVLALLILSFVLGKAEG